jgi:hypothetical protein
MPSTHNQRRRTIFAACACLAVLACALTALRASGAKEWKSGIVWPKPPIIQPGSATEAPSDAIVLFDGQDMSAWEGGPWKIEDGYAVADKGGIRTKQGFGSCQLHLEWAAPSVVSGEGQGRGNSGVYLMGQYEVQILDSFENETYYDGQAGAIYKQSPPMVNACRPPGEWQTYDIIFTAPQFDKDGKLAKPALLTVLHNGVLIQNHFQLQGATAWHKPPEYTAHGDKLPIHLQYHGNPVRVRNIWIREL